MQPRIGITSSPRPHDDWVVDGVNRSYATAVHAAGGIPLILPVLDPAAADAVLSTVDALVLSGGGDVDPGRYGADAVPEVYGVDPERDAWELALLEAAEDLGIPVLGICRGSQIINVARGGTLVQHVPGHRVPERSGEVIHQVVLAEGSRLMAVARCRALGVNSLHHQAVDAVGRGLRAVAWATDGTVEAIEAVDGSPVLAVQWHPELLPSFPGHPELFAWLVAEAASEALPAPVYSRSDQDSDLAWPESVSTATPS